MRGPFIFLCPEITKENAKTLMGWLNDQDVIRYLSDSPEVSQNIEQIIDKIHLPNLTHLFSQDGRFYMAYDKQDTPVGFVRLVKKGVDYEIVIVIGDRNNWGKKLGKSTIRESLKIAFFELRAQKIIAKIHKENNRSILAFLRAGFSLQTETPMLKTFTLTMDRYLKLIQEGPAIPAEIYITEMDRDRLIKTIASEQHKSKASDQSIQSLEGEINKAIVVNQRQVPKDVVTMNSRALLHFDNEEKEVSLVYPNEANLDANKLSVCSPVGTAILGYREGDIIEWEVPSGTTEIYIKKILYQPEAAGDYHL